MKVLILSGISFAFLAACAYSYFQFPKILAENRIFTFVFAVLSLSFPIYFFMRNLGAPSFLLQGLFSVSTIWIGFIFYFSIISLILNFFGIFHIKIPFAFFAALIATAAVLVFGFIKNRNFETREYEVKIEKPIAFPVKIVAASDFHLGYGSSRRKIENIVSAINAQNPDAILIVGDLIDDNTEVLRHRNISEILKRLNAPMGVFAVFGNHEYLAGAKKSEEFYKASNIKLLKGEVAILENGLQIAGLDDFSNKKSKRENDIVKQLKPELPSLLLDHRPHNLQDKANLGFDIQISGHSHNGQMFPLNMITKLLFELDCGYKKINSCHSFVSSGISLWGPPFRIGTKNEMLVLNISNK